MYFIAFIACVSKTKGAASHSAGMDCGGFGLGAVALKEMFMARPDGAVPLWTWGGCATPGYAV